MDYIYDKNLMNIKLLKNTILCNSDYLLAKSRFKVLSEIFPGSKHIFPNMYSATIRYSITKFRQRHM